MSTPHRSMSIRDRLAKAPDADTRFLWGARAGVCLGYLVSATSLGGRAADLAGRSVLIASRDQLAAALALIELDGVARRLVVCPPDMSPEHLSAVVATAEVDAVVSDRDIDTLEPRTTSREPRIETEWILLTSGTTGVPKMLVHSFASLSAPIPDAEDAGVVWGTFYDIRRYGGLQILFRAMLGHGSFVMSSAGEPTGAYLQRLAAHGATHISGTPSHWRRVLMSPEARAIRPRYVRLSGELADQGVLNALQAAYPDAMVSHAFASTEAGVGFEVDDGLEGFPARLMDRAGEVELRVQEGSLRVRSARSASRILGEESSTLLDADGFVDTADMVERRGDRYYFLGRRSGVINVGGLKIHPEEVEATINRHPAVRMSMVRSRKSSITGSLVTADVVLKDAPGSSWPDGSIVGVQREILQICRDNLAPHKIPRTIRFVPALDIAGAGKLARRA
jgi:acyl-coenzyme A synthetase/AMP-(fatty) acid ligase